MVIEFSTKASPDVHVYVGNNDKDTADSWEVTYGMVLLHCTPRVNSNNRYGPNTIKSQCAINFREFVHQFMGMIHLDTFFV